MRVIKFFAAAASLIATATPNSAQALTWNFSFQVDNGSSGSGTFTTASTTPVANQTEAITGISGTYTRAGVATFAITGLTGYNNASNTFQWDGTNSSPIISDVNGIGLEVFNIAYRDVSLSFNNSGYFPIDTITTSFFGSDGSIGSSSLSPVQAASPAPAPLPLIGAGAAFCWSRRLRRRVKPASTVFTVSSSLPL